MAISLALLGVRRAKGTTTYAITWGVCHHSMPMIIWLGILYTDVLYILLNAYAHFLVRKEMRSKT